MEKEHAEDLATSSRRWIRTAPDEPWALPAAEARAGAGGPACRQAPAAGFVSADRARFRAGLQVQELPALHDGVGGADDQPHQSPQPTGPGHPARAH